MDVKARVIPNDPVLVESLKRVKMFSDKLALCNQVYTIAFTVDEETDDVEGQVHTLISLCVRKGISYIEHAFIDGDVGSIYLLLLGIDANVVEELLKSVSM